MDDRRARGIGLTRIVRTVAAPLMGSNDLPTAVQVAGTCPPTRVGPAAPPLAVSFSRCTTSSPSNTPRCTVAPVRSKSPASGTLT
ncbi:hypothetical protein JD77_00259 [Micromonospora olivasterospora]|uniref:Uncharacterized protein n=1 Tax=Micromonospora olivasterospora TaxID=1880 RepID=A0A562I3W3_MICOL|nr:hypothetical protein JD77_00259 [Micromonospora olivasterospora]